MQSRSRLPYAYLIIAAVVVLGWPFLQNAIWPPPPKQRPAKPEEVLALYAGTPALVAIDKDVDAPAKAAAERKEQFPSALGLGLSTPVTVAVHPEVDAPAKVAAERRELAVKNRPPSRLLGMGWGDNPFRLRVLLHTRGAAIQQLVLTQFQEEDREGYAVVNKDGTARPLHLIPGVKFERTHKMRDQRDVEIPDLKPGDVTP